MAQRGRFLVREALAYSLTESRSSRASAARWMGVDEATLRRWLKGTRSVRVEAVLASERLSNLFAQKLRDLCACKKGSTFMPKIDHEALYRRVLEPTQ